MHEPMKRSDSNATVFDIALWRDGNKGIKMVTVGGDGSLCVSRLDDGKAVVQGPSFPDDSWHAGRERVRAEQAVPVLCRASGGGERSHRRRDDRKPVRVGLPPVGSAVDQGVGQRQAARHHPAGGQREPEKDAPWCVRV
jgi:hypothetical protein